MNTFYNYHENAHMICVQYITPLVQSLSACQGLLRSAKDNILMNEAIYTYVIVNCRQLISFLGINYCNGKLTGTGTSLNETYLPVNVLGCGGKAVNVDELTNIRKNLLTRMLLTADHIHHLGYIRYAGETECLKDIYFDKGGIDYLLLLLKENFYDQTGTEFPMNAGLPVPASPNIIGTLL